MGFLWADTVWKFLPCLYIVHSWMVWVVGKCSKPTFSLLLCSNWVPQSITVFLSKQNKLTRIRQVNVNIICSWFLEGLLAVNPKWDQGQIKNLTENQILILMEEKGWHSTSDQLCGESRPQILDIRVSYSSSIPWLTAVVLKSKGKVEVHCTFSDINNVSSPRLRPLWQVLHKPLHCANTAASSKTAWKLIQQKNQPIFSWWYCLSVGSGPWSCSPCN